jgi:Helix-turn-helix domain
VRDNQYMPLADAAQRLGVSWGRAWRLALTGVLEARKVGRLWTVSRSSVERLLQQAHRAQYDCSETSLPE